MFLSYARDNNVHTDMATVPVMMRCWLTENNQPHTLKVASSILTRCRCSITCISSKLIIFLPINGNYRTKTNSSHGKSNLGQSGLCREVSNDTASVIPSDKEQNPIMRAR